ncbi:MAG: polyribonucleotide nucleotidyltransferase [Desulfobacterales bacterium]|nr:polyribonucleotide nucleotidyltransferase [Desulfobacterales bacterium]
MEVELSANLSGKLYTFRSGKIAKQAAGSVLVQYGETIVLVTVVSSNEVQESVDFIPLSVEYQEKIYSAGRIPGNYYRREMGRPTEKEILTCRLIDRPIRPLFPKNYHYETQIIATVLSMDRENDPDVLAMVGASAALSISDIPFNGPIAGVRVARINNEFIINPTISQAKDADINIVVAGSKTGVIMVEGGANIVSEQEMLDAIFYGHKAMQPLIELQEQFVQKIGKPKRIVAQAQEIDPELSSLIESRVADKMKICLCIKEKAKRNQALHELKLNSLADIEQTYPNQKNEINEIWNTLKRQLCRNIIVYDGQRIDGRQYDEIRPIECEVGLLPRPHGSALFTRGETQVLGILTLGSGYDEQRIETLSGDEAKPFMLHYNFPPFSVGEVKRLSGPSRRDIGHGHLATRAIEKVMPAKEEFNYTVRLVAEVTESNGSSSMGTVCAGTLALMDGGIPIKAPVSGIAMGLVKEGDHVVILSDILGDEDHTGDMDFKVAGTKDGIAAMQMDIKISEITKDILEKALEQARVGRLHILSKMMETLDTVRTTMSLYAPKVSTVQINPDKIREIIGLGGKKIRAIQQETNTRIEIEDSGLVKISGDNKTDCDAAIKIVSDIALDPEIGEIYDGLVVKTTDFGAFVQIKSGVDGLVHISELAHHRVKKVTDIVKEGDTIKVKVLEISGDGKIRLSHKSTLENDHGSKY